MIKQQMKEVVQSFRPRQLASVVLFQQGKTCAEIAEAISLDITVVRDELFHGVRMLTTAHKLLREASHASSCQS